MKQYENLIYHFYSLYEKSFHLLRVGADGQSLCKHKDDTMSSYIMTLAKKENLLRWLDEESEISNGFMQW